MNQYKTVQTPPGGLMIWIFIIAELVVFICVCGAFLYQRSTEPLVFLDSRLKLNADLATLNTCILLLSSFFMANAAKFYELNKTSKKIIPNLYYAFILGIIFLFIKFYEYSQKWDSGIFLGTNSFFDYYWILTVFHALHLIVGLLIILVLIFHQWKKIEYSEEDFNLITGANYWHLCDLIWVLIFPILYLI